MPDRIFYQEKSTFPDIRPGIPADSALKENPFPDRPGIGEFCAIWRTFS
jgi:hypothetical protein